MSVGSPVRSEWLNSLLVSVGSPVRSKWLNSPLGLRLDSLVLPMYMLVLL